MNILPLIFRLGRILYSLFSWLLPTVSKWKNRHNVLLHTVNPHIFFRLFAGHSSNFLLSPDGISRGWPFMPNIKFKTPSLFYETEMNIIWIEVDKKQNGKKKPRAVQQYLSPRGINEQKGLCNDKLLMPHECLKSQCVSLLYRKSIGVCCIPVLAFSFESFFYPFLLIVKFVLTITKFCFNWLYFLNFYSHPDFSAFKIQNRQAWYTVYYISVLAHGRWLTSKRSWGSPRSSGPTCQMTSVPRASSQSLTRISAGTATQRAGEDFCYSL